jgi:opacity protein-like surface antigen
MVRVTILGLAGAAALLSTATVASTTALAADLPPPLPPPVYAPPPVVVPGGWYLRGDVGVGWQTFSDFTHTQSNANFVWPASWQIVQKDVKSPAFVGFGVGYAWNNWARFDFTGEFRANVPFKVVGMFSGARDFCLPGGPDGNCFDVLEGNHSAWVFLTNAYLDLGTWWCLTPFIGAGAGAARHTIHSFTDTGIIANGSVGFGLADQDTFTKTNFAWALHAGVAYNVTNNVKIELAYRYLNMGNVDTGAITCQNTPSCPHPSFTFTNFISNDFRIGVRFLLAPEPVMAPPPPLVRKG